MAANEFLPPWKLVGMEPAVVPKVPNWLMIC